MNKKSDALSGETNCTNTTRDASETRDYWVAKNATLRAARPDPLLREERFQDDKQTAPLRKQAKD